MKGAGGLFGKHSIVEQSIDSTDRLSVFWNSCLKSDEKYHYKIKSKYRRYRGVSLKSTILGTETRDF